MAAAVLSPASAQTTKLRIEVKSAAGKPVDRASVLVKFVEGRSIVKLGKKIRTSWELKTNQDGVASIPPIPQGDDPGAGDRQELSDVRPEIRHQRRREDGRS